MTEHQHDQELPPEAAEHLEQQARRKRSMAEMIGSGSLDRARRAMDEERDR